MVSFGKRSQRRAIKFRRCRWMWTSSLPPISCFVPPISTSLNSNQKQSVILWTASCIMHHTLYINRFKGKKYSARMTLYESATPKERIYGFQLFQSPWSPPFLHSGATDNYTKQRISYPVTAVGNGRTERRAGGGDVTWRALFGCTNWTLDELCFDATGMK